jgi:hypothetical protein
VKWIELLLIVLVIQLASVLVKLDRLIQGIDKIVENLPSENAANEKGIAGFWSEIRFSMNRLARIYEKFYLGQENIEQIHSLPSTSPPTPPDRYETLQRRLTLALYEIDPHFIRLQMNTIQMLETKTNSELKEWIQGLIISYPTL